MNCRAGYLTWQRQEQQHFQEFGRGTGMSGRLQQRRARRLYGFICETLRWVVARHTWNAKTRGVLLKYTRQCVFAWVALSLVINPIFSPQPVVAGSFSESSPTLTYSATETIPAPPASSYEGSGGGDGWALALTPTAVYNVFHHATKLQVACHLQVDASPCWSPKTISDGSGHGFATSGQPGLWLDQVSARLYVYATRISDLTGGVACIDTTQPASNANPFCGFTPLTAVGDAPLYGGISGISNPALVGSRWYAFNYVNGVGLSGNKNQLLCFDTASLSACASQPYTLAMGTGKVVDTLFPEPAVVAIGSQIIIPLALQSGQQLGCFDGNTQSKCAGTWPVPLAFSYASNDGAPFPMLTPTGGITGLCLPSTNNPCFSLTGASVATPASLSAAVPSTSGWNGAALVLGPRVYVPDGQRNRVDCYDFATSAACTSFPKAPTKLSLLYTVNADPQRPTCLWVNSDAGASQIQNFDAYTGGPCGQQPIRVLAANLIPPNPACVPLSYTSLQVLSPPPSSYSSGSVDFKDGDANPLPGVPTRPLDTTGTVDLSSLNLTGGFGLPQFLITLAGLQGTLSSVVVKLTWTGVSDPACGAVPIPSDEPITATGVPITTTEGHPFSGQVASIADPDTAAFPGDYLATIDWGDGAAPSIGTISGSGGAFAVSGVHTYADEGSFTLSVKVQDADDLSISAIATSPVTVTDAALSARPTASSSALAFSGAVAGFTDANNIAMLADFTATIDWGDGSSPSAGTVVQTGSTHAVNGSHTYARTGWTTLKVHIVDHAGSTAETTQQLLIYGTPTGGNFVIGDQSAAVGKTVNYWGDQWWINNSMSTAPTPVSFKGFEDSPAAASCGTSWTTDPGNSTPPPLGPLPPYMATTVSSRITQIGPSISGDTVGLAVVTTASDYAPNPGHSASATVVGWACPAPPAPAQLIADNPLSSATIGSPYSYTFAASGSPAPSFALASGSLPAGLNLDRTSGVLSGTPTSAGVSSFSIKATNASGADSISPTLTITVTPAPVPPAFTADSPPTAAIVGVPYTYTFAATGAPAAEYALASGMLPQRFELDAVTGMLSGTPLDPGTFTFTLKATNAVSPDAISPTLTIIVSAPPKLTADSPPSAGIVGVPYSYRFAATGTPTPTFAVATGALPDGLQLDSATGLLSGTPTKGGVFTFTIKASNGAQPDAISPPLTITVTAPPAFTADTPPVTGIVGTAYSYTFVATGMPGPTFAVANGGLPDGLQLDPTSGLLSGTPTTAGIFAFKVKASNGTLPDAVSPPLTITVAPQPVPPLFTADTPPATAMLGATYSYQFLANGVPAPTYALASGTLPDALTLDSTTGILSGTPTVMGAFTFTVKATNGVTPDAVSPTLTITVDPAGAAPVFTGDTPPPSGVVGAAYSYTFTATGTPPPAFAVTSGSLPDGLSLEPASGTLSGTPTTTGTFTFTIQASNGISPDAITPSLSITIGAVGVAPVLTAFSPPASAAVGIPYSYTFQATGTPQPTFVMVSGSLPDGLTLDPVSGVLSGTPTKTGAFTFSVKASNGINPYSLTPALTITVSTAVAPAFTADSPPATATIGHAYAYQFAASGKPSPSFAVALGALPDGLGLQPQSGILSGTPTVTGTFTFTIQASNGVSPDAVTPTLTITVAPAGPAEASNDAYTVQSGAELDVAAPGVLGNDTNADPSRTLTAVLQHDPAKGILELHSDGSFGYVPGPGFAGTDIFTYVARDNTGAVSSTATVSITVTSGGPPTPTLGAISPGTGSTITGPVNISATLTPPNGETITTWSVSYRRPGDSTLIELASGSGSNVAATFDPTLVRDGTYAINIRAESSGGGVFDTESGVIVDGTYKPGRYATTFSDLTLNAANIPINIRRTYDSANRVQSDFGIGWSIDVANFRIDTNGPLGSGGWSQYSCASFPFLATCYKTSRPHVVSVTWPDGHVEKFDLTPAKSTLLLPLFTTSAYTAEPGSTSTLQAIDQGLVLTGSDFMEGTMFGTTGIYDPLTFILTARGGTQYTIARRGGLLKLVDANGNTLTIDSGGIHSSSGPSVAFNRDANSRVTEIIGPTGSIEYTYSSAGDLTAVQYPNGASQAFTYDSQHDLVSVSGGGQLVRTLTYDASGRITAVTDGNGNTSTISSNVAGHQQAYTDATGTLTTVDSFNGRGDLIQQDQTFGGKTITTKATFDVLGHQLTSTDALGHTTTATYDGAGNVVSQTDPDGNATTYTYNALGQPLTTTDALGNVTTETYDAHGNLLTQTAPDGGVTTYTYDSAGHPLTQTDPSGRITTYTYDSSGRLASITDPAGNTSHFTVDPATAQVTSVTNPDGAKTSFTYDSDGNTTGVTDANGHTSATTYDSFDRVTSRTDPTGQTVHYSYDGAGNPASIVDRNGATTSFGYDADSRLVSKTVPGGDTDTYTYDPLGRMVSATNSTARLGFSYDDAGNLLTESSTGTATSPQPPTTFSYSYDPAGLRIGVEGPNGKTTYSYNPNQRLVALTDPSGGMFAFGYSPAGRLISVSRPNGVDDAITYNPAGDLTSLHSSLGPTLVNQADYTYNAAGQRAILTTTAGTTSFGYDPASQLVSATYPASTGFPSQSYTYDLVGNRTSTSASPLGSFTYDSANRLLTDGTNDYTYDKEGNLLSSTVRATGATTSYTWSAERQLTGITYPNGSKAAFRYDPVGRQVEVDAGTTITRYAYDQHSVAAEYDGTNTLTASYVHGDLPTNALEMFRGGQRYIYLTDALGSTTYLTRMSGAVANSYTYDAFGTPNHTGTVANPFTFTGQPFDANSGLVQFPLRTYDPSRGRFLSEDPLPAGNPYVYVSNNPVNRLDPSGGQEEQEYNNTVYIAREEEGCYVGITKNFFARQSAHGARFEFGLTPIAQGLSRTQARSLETYIMNVFGGPGGGLLTNIINSIALTDEAVAYAEKYLEANGEIQDLLLSGCA